MTLDVARWIVSAVFIVAANVAPAVGILGYGWDALLLLSLYWLETVVIAFWQGLRVAVAFPRWRPVRGRRVTYFRKGKGVSESTSVTEGGKAPLLVAFLFGHLVLLGFYGLFVVLLVGQGDPAAVRGRLTAEAGAFGLIALLLMAEHGWEFFATFVRGPAWMRSDALFHSLPAIGRFFLLHLVLIGGAVFAAFFRAPGAVLIVFIVLKTAGDLLGSILSRAGEWQRNPPLAAPGEVGGGATPPAE